MEGGIVIMKGEGEGDEGGGAEVLFMLGWDIGL